MSKSKQTQNDPHLFEGFSQKPEVADTLFKIKEQFDAFCYEASKVNVSRTVVWNRWNAFAQNSDRQLEYHFAKPPKVKRENKQR